MKKIYSTRSRLSSIVQKKAIKLNRRKLLKGTFKKEGTGERRTMDEETNRPPERTWEA